MLRTSCFRVRILPDALPSCVVCPTNPKITPLELLAQRISRRVEGF